MPRQQPNTTQDAKQPAPVSFALDGPLDGKGLYPMETLKNQVILVTDVTDGLGRRVARDLAALEATVLLQGRSREVFPKDCQKAYDLGAALVKKPDYWNRIGPEESES